MPENARNVGGYEDLPRPGERTDVVMAAHRDWWGIGPVVFDRLEELRPRDRADVTGATDQETEVLQVHADVDVTPLTGDHGSEALTLITCGGTFSGIACLNRRTVRARRI